MAARTFTDVTLIAEHVPETHRTLENDLTVTERELPGTVEVYLVIDGGRIPFTHLRGGDVLEAIDRAGEEQRSQQAATPPAETTQPAGQQAEAPAPETTPAPEQPQG